MMLTVRYTMANAGSRDFNRRETALIENSCSSRAAGLSREKLNASAEGANTSPPCATAPSMAAIQLSPITSTEERRNV